MRSYPVKENPISSAVSEILHYKQTNRQTDRHEATLLPLPVGLEVPFGRFCLGDAPEPPGLLDTPAGLPVLWLYKFNGFVTVGPFVILPYSSSLSMLVSESSDTSSMDC